MKQREKNIQEMQKLDKKEKDLEKKYDGLFGKSSSLKIAQDPNDDPQDLYSQIQPILRNMGVSNLVDRRRTQLIVGKNRGNDNLYQVVLRRNAEIDGEVISRMNRNVNDIEVMKWTPQAIELYIWAPYRAPEEELPEAIE